MKERTFRCKKTTRMAKRVLFKDPLRERPFEEAARLRRSRYLATLREQSHAVQEARNYSHFLLLRRADGALLALKSHFPVGRRAHT